MDAKLITVVIASFSSLITGVVTHFYHRRETENDLETKLIERVESLTSKILDLNNAYMNSLEVIQVLKIENEKLKQEINLLKNVNTKLYRNSTIPKGRS